MDSRDFYEFCEMLDDVWGFYPQAKAPTAGQKAMFFRALSGMNLGQVRDGFDSHVKDSQRGRFPPLPADIIAQAEGNLLEDGRPGPEEAWAIAIKAADEAATVVWTDEAAQAWNIAQAVYQAGDEVGARMAFKEAYTRLVAASRASGLKPKWFPSFGHDPAQRDVALQAAHVNGFLPKPEKLAELPAPDNAMSLTNKSMPERVRENLLVLRERLVASKERAGPIDATKELKRRADDAVTEYSRRADE